MQLKQKLITQFTSEQVLDTDSNENAVRSHTLSASQQKSQFTGTKNRKFLYKKPRYLLYRSIYSDMSITLDDLKKSASDMNITMEELNNFGIKEVFAMFVDFLRICIFRMISVGRIPTHIAFIMDGNRRYARRNNLKEGAGHRVGFLALMSVLKYCYELQIKYVTVYAFAIDNFRRRPDEVKTVMELLEEKSFEMVGDLSTINKYGVKIQFLGNLNLLKESTRKAVEKAMELTAKNDKIVLSICVAYSSTDEITHAAREAYNERQSKLNEPAAIRLADINRHMYLAGVPDPDILVRTSGETRLSNFLLWQTSYTYLHSPAVLWPGITMWTLLWVILNYQRAQPYLDKKRKFA